MSIHKILIPLDSSTLSEKILAAVRTLFSPEETELTLLSVAPWGAATPSPASSLASSVPDQTAWARIAQSRDAALRTQAEALQAAGYKVTILTLSGDPVQEIIATLEKGKYDLVAMATHGQSGAERQLMGSVAERVLRRIRVPILFLRPFAQTAAESAMRTQSLPVAVSTSPLTLATATDGSTHAQRARVLAQHLAQTFQAQLKVIVVADEHSDAASAQELIRNVQRRLGAAAPAVELIPLVGRTDIALERYVSEHPADLLIIGAFKDRDAGATTHIGLTAQQIVQHVPVSVLVAKGFAPTLRKLLVFVARGDERVIEVGAQWARVLQATLQLIYLLPPTEEQSDENAPRLADLPLNEIMVHGLFRHELSLADAVKTVSLETALREESADAPVLQGILTRMQAMGLPPDALLLRRGPNVRTILYVAEQEHADLIIVNSPWEPAFFLDSIANAVVQLAPRSVLVVRTTRQEH